MQKLSACILGILCLVASSVYAADLPRVVGLSITGDQLTWDAQDGATGYNIYLGRHYFDTVRGVTSYTVTEPGIYQVVSFNDAGDFGVLISADEPGRPFDAVEYTIFSDTIKYDLQPYALYVYNTCKDVGPGETCIARCPNDYRGNFGNAYIQYLSGGACSTSDIVEADAFVGPRTYRCTVPTFSGEVVAQAICVVNY